MAGVRVSPAKEMPLQLNRIAATVPTMVQECFRFIEVKVAMQRERQYNNRQNLWKEILPKSAPLHLAPMPDDNAAA